MIDAKLISLKDKGKDASGDTSLCLLGPSSSPLNYYSPPRSELQTTREIQIGVADTLEFLRLVFPCPCNRNSADITMLKPTQRVTSIKETKSDHGERK